MSSTTKPELIGKGKTEGAAALVEQVAIGAQTQATRGFERTVESLKQGAATASASFEQAQVHVKEGFGHAMKTAEQFAAFSQGNLEAFVKSNQVLGQGLQDMGKHVAATMQTSFEETVATVKAMSGVKSLKEAFDLQVGFLRNTTEKAIAESGKLTEQSVKLAEQVTAPIAARFTAAVETFRV